MKQTIARIVNGTPFEYFIVGLILINAAVLGMETDPDLLARYGTWFEIAHRAILIVFVIEAALKIYAVWPRLSGYFGSGWNLFDFSIVVLSLVPATGEFALIARMARLFRVLRLITAIPELRLIVTTLIRSIPSMANIMILMSVLFYIYAVAGYHFFHEIDPTHWRNLGISLLTLFRVVTLEDWTDVMYNAMEGHPWAWLYFVSFVVVGTFVIVNLFIAVVLNNLQEAKLERLRELQPLPSREELMEQMRNTQDALDRLQQQLHLHGDNPAKQRNET